MWVSSYRWCLVSMVSLVFALGVTGCQNGADKSGAAGPKAGNDKVADRAYVDAMTKEHAHDTTAPTDETKVAPKSAVVSERLAYAEVGNKLVYGHFVIPADMVDPLPAVIMIHEWWGLNDNVRAMADRLAGEGYIVLAVDLYGGNTATTADEARRLMSSVIEDPETANENIRQAYKFVVKTAGAPRVASLGWCFGGGWSLNTAMLFPDQLAAAVIYYGQVTDDVERLRPIQAPILGFFGARDQSIPVASVRAFENVLKSLNKNVQIKIYPEASHAFANPSGTNYNASAAQDSWNLTLKFLNQYLVASGDSATTSSL